MCFYIERDPNYLEKCMKIGPHQYRSLRILRTLSTKKDHANFKEDKDPGQG